MPYRDPEKRRAAAREATRRWQQRHGKQYAPRRRQLDRDRYAANRESVLSARRKRYASDQSFADGVRAHNRDWYGRNREKRREYWRRYRQEHGDELRAKQRERNRRRYAENPRAWLDYYKRWRQRNLERARAYARIAGNTPRPECTSHLKSGRPYSLSTPDAVRIAAQTTASRRTTARRSVAEVRMRSATSCRRVVIAIGANTGGPRRSSARYSKVRGELSSSRAKASATGSRDLAAAVRGGLGRRSSTVAPRQESAGRRSRSRSRRHRLCPP